MRRDVLKGTYFTHGAVSCAEGAIAAGCRFFAAYPITPATDIAEHMARRMPEVGGICIQMEDEIAAASAIIGASYACVKSMTATSGPGFSLMAESVGLAVMTETPIVIAYIMRGGPSTGQPTKAGYQDVMQVRWSSHGDYELVALAPMTVQEMFDLTVEAFNLSEQYRVPVILVADETVAHARERLKIPDPSSIKLIERKKPATPSGEYLPKKAEGDLVPPMACFGEGYHVHATGLTHGEDGLPDPESAETHSRLVKRLCDKIRKNVDKIVKTEGYMLEDADMALVAYGVNCRSAISAAEAARMDGLKLGVLRLVSIWPFPDRAVKNVADRVEAIFVPETNYGQLVREVERVARTTPVYSIPKLGGEIHTPEEILGAVRRFQLRPST